MKLQSQKELARKAFYASIGAPVVAGRMAKDYADKLASKSTEIGETAQKHFEELSVEGEKAAKQLRKSDVVEKVQDRVDFDKVQDRVEKLRDQLDGALETWRESFVPAAKPVEVKATATKPAAKKATTKPATKKATAKPAASKSAAAKPAASKKSTSKSATTKSSTKKSAPKASSSK